MHCAFSNVSCWFNLLNGLDEVPFFKRHYKWFENDVNIAFPFGCQFINRCSGCFIQRSLSTRCPLETKILYVFWQRICVPRYLPTSVDKARGLSTQLRGCPCSIRILIVPFSHFRFSSAVVKLNCIWRSPSIIRHCVAVIKQHVLGNVEDRLQHEADMRISSCVTLWEQTCGYYDMKSEKLQEFMWLLLSVRVWIRQGSLS